MLTCNRCRQKFYARQIHSPPRGFFGKLIDLYDKRRGKMLEARRQFNRFNPRNTPLPTGLLREWGKYCTLQLVINKLEIK